MAVYYTVGSMLRGRRYCLDENMPFPTTHPEASDAACKAAEHFWWEGHDSGSTWLGDFYLFPDKDTEQATWCVEVDTREVRVFETKDTEQLLKPEEGK